MFCSEGGAGVGGRMEKQRPWAWLGPWYGSWPVMTTLTVLRGVCRDLSQHQHTHPHSNSNSNTEQNSHTYHE